MKDLLQNTEELVKLCKQLDYDPVIKAVLGNREFKAYVRKLVADDKASYQEIQHDAVLSLIRTAAKKDFEFQKSPIAYLKTIAKNLWLMKLRRYRKQSELHHASVKQEDLFVYQPSEEKRELLDKILKLLKEDCREILTLWAYKYKLSEIAAKLNIDSTQYLKKKKHLCLKKLIALIDRDSGFKEELRQYV